MASSNYVSFCFPIPSESQEKKKTIPRACWLHGTFWPFLIVNCISFCHTNFYFNFCIFLFVAINVPQNDFRLKWIKWRHPYSIWLSQIKCRNILINTRIFNLHEHGTYTPLGRYKDMCVYIYMYIALDYTRQANFHLLSLKTKKNIPTKKNGFRMVLRGILRVKCY